MDGTYLSIAFCYLDTNWYRCCYLDISWYQCIRM